MTTPDNRNAQDLAKIRSLLDHWENGGMFLDKALPAGSAAIKMPLRELLIRWRDAEPAQAPIPVTVRRSNRTGQLSIFPDHYPADFPTADTYHIFLQHSNKVNPDDR